MHLSRGVENYIKSRPHYPAAIIDLLRKECHLDSQHIIADTGLGTFKEAWFDNPLICDFQGLKGRILSNGPALEQEDPTYGPMIKALEKIFLNHQ